MAAPKKKPPKRAVPPAATPSKGPPNRGPSKPGMKPWDMPFPQAPRRRQGR